jgi:rubrerythrin
METECLECGYIWQAVFPEDVESLLECPYCGAIAGFNIA